MGVTSELAGTSQPCVHVCGVGWEWGFQEEKWWSQKQNFSLAAENFPLALTAEGGWPMYLCCVSRGFQAFWNFSSLSLSLLWPSANLIISRCLCLLRITAHPSGNPVGTAFVKRNYRAKEGAGFGVGSRWVGAEVPCLPQGSLCGHPSLAIPAQSQAGLRKLQVHGWGGVASLPHAECRNLSCIYWGHQCPPG